MKRTELIKSFIVEAIQSSMSLRDLFDATRSAHPDWNVYQVMRSSLDTITKSVKISKIPDASGKRTVTAKDGRLVGYICDSKEIRSAVMVPRTRYASGYSTTKEWIMYALDGREHKSRYKIDLIKFLVDSAFRDEEREIMSAFKRLLDR